MFYILSHIKKGTAMFCVGEKQWDFSIDVH